MFLNKNAFFIQPKLNINDEVQFCQKKPSKNSDLGKNSTRRVKNVVSDSKNKFSIFRCMYLHFTPTYNYNFKYEVKSYILPTPN